VVAGLDGADGFVGFELNLSCPNTSAGGIEFGADPASVARIVAACRAVTRRPLVVKISPALPDIVAIALAARDAGADGVSLINTLPGYLFAPGTTQPRLGNGNGGVSGPALLPVGTLATRKVAERTGGEFPIIGVGGITTAADVRQYLSAGAHLVAIGTACLADPRQPERIVADLEQQHG
jgi:dihydroorotate dehydrogenase (NAD+) catalytic subunit